MKRSTWWRRSTAAPPDRDLTPYWDQLAEAGRADSFNDVERWLQHVQRKRQPATAFAWTTWFQAPPLRLAFTALLLILTGVACTIPVAHEAPFGTVVTGTLPLPPDAARSQLASVPGIDARLLTTTAVLDPWRIEPSTAFAIVLDVEAAPLDRLQQDLSALGSMTVTTQTLTEPQQTPVYQLVLRALPGRAKDLTAADRAAHHARLEVALETHREALEAEHLVPAFVTNRDGATDLTWTDTPTPTTFDQAIGALQTVQPFLVDALGPETFLAMAQSALPDASAETLQPLAELAERLYSTQDTDGQTRLLQQLRAEMDSDGTLTTEDLNRIVRSFD